MRVEYTRKAEVDIIEIWNDNAERYNVDQANKYIHFLFVFFFRFSVLLVLGSLVERFPCLRSLTVQRRAGGHGHTAFYELREDSIRIDRVLHTAMDHLSHLGDGW